ncbi:MAG: hypothetical protein ACQETI_11260 [Halobacteriota archaeon]
MQTRLDMLMARPGWLVFAAFVLVVSGYQLYIGQTLSGGIGILVAIALVLSLLFQPPQPEDAQ